MSVENQKRFLALLAGGKPIPPDLADWYLKASQTAYEENKPLCICLGIRQPGIRSARTIDLIKRRDILLKFSLSYCVTDLKEPVWSRCGTLLNQIQRWPDSKEENPLLNELFKLGVKLPQSQQGIYERIKVFYPPLRYRVDEKKDNKSFIFLKDWPR